MAFIPMCITVLLFGFVLFSFCLFAHTLFFLLAHCICALEFSFFLFSYFVWHVPWPKWTWLSLSLSLMHFRKNPNQNKTIQMKINFYTNKQTYIEMLCTYFGRSLCASATKYHLINWSLHSGRPILISAVDSVCIRMLPSLRLCWRARINVWM